MRAIHDVSICKNWSINKLFTKFMLDFILVQFIIVNAITFMAGCLTCFSIRRHGQIASEKGIKPFIVPSMFAHRTMEIDVRDDLTYLIR